MRKRYVIIFMLIIMNCLVSCGVEEKDDKKIGDVEFEIIAQENFPKEVKNIINDKKETEFKTSYTEGEDLYIIAGYGRQPTGGYSVGVEELYQTNNNIYLKLKFMGPAKTEKVTQEISYPYIVIKMKDIGKSVVFK